MLLNSRAVLPTESRHTLITWANKTESFSRANPLAFSGLAGSNRHTNTAFLPVGPASQTGVSIDTRHNTRTKLTASRYKTASQFTDQTTYYSQLPFNCVHTQYVTINAGTRDRNTRLASTRT